MITKNGYILASSAIGSVEMPDEVRIALVEQMAKNFAADNPKFDADRFRFACKVFHCSICKNDHDEETVVAGDIKKYWNHVLESHPEYKDIAFDREVVR